jgi:hypothetical protein
VTEVSSAAGLSTSASGSPARNDSAGNAILRRLGSWMPTWGLIETKLLEMRKRRGLMVAIVVLIMALPVLVLGFRLLFHAIDPKTYAPAGSPGIFSGLVNGMAEFGFIAAATLGAAAGTTDLTDGMFRHLVITGRSRLALYLARIPSGLAIVLPLVGVAFAMVCLVTSYAGTPQPTTIGVNNASVPTGLDQAQLETWLIQHPQQAAAVFQEGPLIGKGGGPAPAGPAPTPAYIERNAAAIYGNYTADEVTQENPAINEMIKIGLWLELVIGVAFLVGLGLGSLLGQRTVATILMIALEIIVTPLLARTAIPYFLDGQRLVVGIALDQLRPAALGTAGAGGGGPGPGPGHVLFGGRGVLGIPPMPTWAMIAVIVGWIVGWSVIGAWRMMTRDA